jgi:HSP20 family molecular chaperone IbpA
MRTQSIFFPTFFDSLIDEPRFTPAQSHVEENEQGYFIQLDAPGVRKEDVKISVENRHLLIEGERKGKLPQKLRRAFSLPDDVEVEKIAAQMKDGVLELSLPKKEQARPKTIQVQEAKESFFQKLLGDSEQK